MRTPLLLVVIVFNVNLGISVAQTAADEAAVNTLIDDYYSAVAAGDRETVAALYAENGVLALGANVSVGRAAIEARDVGTPRVEFSRTILFLSPTTAIAYGTNEVTSATPPTTGHMVLTAVKEGDDWLVGAIQTAP